MKILISVFSLASLLMLSGCGNSSTPAPAATADAAMMQVVDALNNQNPVGPWNMLPASYQADLTDVKNEFAAKMDADIYNAGAGVVQKVHTVLKDQKELLLASPMLASVPMKEDFSANYDQLVKMLGTLSESDLATLDSLKSMDIGTYLRTTGSELMKTASEMEISDSSPKPMGMNRMLKTPGKILNAKAELISEDGDTAVVRVTAEGEEPQEQTFVRVEGKWIPEDLQKEFPKMIEEMRKGISEIEIPQEAKAQVQMGITMINGVLDQIAAAKTQEELQGALGGLMMMGMGM